MSATKYMSKSEFWELLDKQGFKTKEAVEEKLKKEKGLNDLSQNFSVFQRFLKVQNDPFRVEVTQKESTQKTQKSKVKEALEVFQLRDAEVVCEIIEVEERQYYVLVKKSLELPKTQQSGSPQKRIVIACTKENDRYQPLKEDWQIDVRFPPITRSRGLDYSEVRNWLPQFLVELIEIAVDRVVVVTVDEPSVQVDLGAATYDTAKGNFLKILEKDEQGQQIEREFTNGLYVVGEIIRYIGHRFVLEPIGALRNQPQHIIYRVWCRLTDLDYREGDPYTEITQSGSQRWVHHNIETEDDAQCERVALRYVDEFLNVPNAIVLHCQCNSHRETDLLQAIIDPLKKELGLNRIPIYNTEQGSPIETAINDWINKYLGGLTEAERNSLISLLLGSKDDRSFKSVKSVLTNFFRVCRLPLRVVIENATNLDETLRDCIPPKNIPQGTDLVIVEVRSQGNNSQLPKPKYPTDVQKLIAIARVLGWDFLLSWLRTCWVSLRNGSKRDFIPAMEEAYRHGAFQFAGSLRDLNDPNKFYREIKFGHNFASSGSDVDNPSSELRKNVLGIFMNKFIEKVTENNSDLSRIRCKIRVLKVLEEYTNSLSEHDERLLIMSKLAARLGDRAHVSGALHEAERRYRLAFHWWMKCKQIQTPDAINHGLETIHKYLERRPENEDLVSIWERVDELTDGDVNRDAAIRSIQAITINCIWNSNLDMAKICLGKYKAHADNRDDVLQEWRHLSVVVHFFRGEFRDSDRHGRAGREYCERNKSYRPREGKHDGRVCCKVFEALSLLNLGDTQTAGLRINALYQFLQEYYNDNRDNENQQFLDNTLLVGISYIAIYYILNGEYYEGGRKCGVYQDFPFNTEVHWAVFRQMILLCIEIGEKWRKNESHDWEASSKVLMKHLDRWNRSEHLVVFHTFLTICEWQISVERGEACLKRLMVLINSTEEVWFIPESLRLIAQLQTDLDKKREYLELALARTSDQMVLYRSKIEYDLKQFN